MAKTTSKILVLVEGAKTDVKLMEHLFSVYQFDTKYQIVSYCTNIYTLYHEMFQLNDPEYIDLLQLLKSRERDPQKKQLFDEAYSDILLVFDLDPQDSKFTPDSIRRMSEYFVESSDMGKLYLNYPMVEAFYHMKEIPDPDYDCYYATMQELLAGTYKKRVNQENRNHNYRKFAVNRGECNSVIKQNLAKARKLTNCGSESFIPEQLNILDAQLLSIDNEGKISVLSTCPFFIPEYNPKLIDE